MVAVLDEVIMDEHGESIGTRELINEIRLKQDQAAMCDARGHSSYLTVGW